MSELTVEEIDPESWLAREVYANFGLAMYCAQVLEHGLVNLAVWSGIRDRVYSAYGEVEADMLALFRLTMGNLRITLIALRPDVRELEEMLASAVALRDFLAHRYFRERAAAFMTDDGKRQMIEELQRARGFFADLDPPPSAPPEFPQGSGPMLPIAALSDAVGCPLLGAVWERILLRSPREERPRRELRISARAPLAPPAI